MAVMLYVRFPLSLRIVEDLLHERGIEVSHEAVRYWWHRFGPMFASEIRKRRVGRLRQPYGATCYVESSAIASPDFCETVRIGG